MTYLGVMKTPGAKLFALLISVALLASCNSMRDTNHAPVEYKFFKDSLTHKEFKLKYKTCEIHQRRLITKLVYNRGISCCFSDDCKLKKTDAVYRDRFPHAVYVMVYGRNVFHPPTAYKRSKNLQLYSYCPKCQCGQKKAINAYNKERKKRLENK